MSGSFLLQYFCDVSNAQLNAAMEYTQFYKQGLAIPCDTYVKVNLIHDLR